MRAASRFWASMGTQTLLAVGVALLGKPATVAFPGLALGMFRFSVAAVGFPVRVKLRGYDLRTPLPRG